MTAQEAIENLDRYRKKLHEMEDDFESYGFDEGDLTVVKDMIGAIDAMICLVEGKKLSCEGCDFNGTTSGLCRICVRQANDYYQQIKGKKGDIHCLW